MTLRSKTCCLLSAILLLALADTRYLLTPAAAEKATGPLQTATLDRPSERPKCQEKVSKKEKLPQQRFTDRDVDAEDLAEEILSFMTLEEKIGQMNQVFPDGETLSDDLAVQIRDGQIGSIFYTGNANLLQRAQQIAVEQSRLGIPLIVARDVVHGFRTICPIPLGQAASWNADLVRQAAEVAASESRRVGIHWTFAPMVDISRDPRWGRIAESLGEDPWLASQLGAAMVQGFQAETPEGTLKGIAACPKHFVGYGLAEGGRDYNRVMVSQNELHNVFLSSFRACVDAKARTMMTAFNSINGIPATGHEFLLRDVLKQQWEFSGFVVSDWASVSEMITHGYVKDSQEAARAALRAGVDMEMCTTCYQDHLRHLVTSGLVSESLIDDAVKRMLLVKIELGLFSQPYADPGQPELLAPSHRKVARELTRQSLVLLKNDAVLPLKKDQIKRAAIIGPLADAAKDQLGCWVLDGLPEEAVTPLSAIKQILGSEVDVTHVPCLQSKYEQGLSEFEAAVAAAKQSDVALVFVGEEEALSGEAHSRTNLSLPGSQGRLLAELAKLDVPVVMVVIAGRPLTIGDQVEQADAVLYAWHPGTMGGPAIADILFGVESPSGKLPVSFPKSVGQVPLYYNHLNTGRPSGSDYVPPHLRNVKNMPEEVRYRSHYVDSDPYPLFPFGYGLSYSEFIYSELQLSSDSLQWDEALEISVQLQNAGQFAGTETVQLYLRDKVASVLRPVKELKGYQRVSLKPGETTEVSFQLPYKSLGFYDEAGQYLIEPGQFQVWVGGDSKAKLSTDFQLE